MTKAPVTTRQRVLALVLALLACSFASHVARAQSGTTGGVFESADPVLAPMMRPGKVVDASPFTHRRAVRLYPSAAGVSRYALAPADLAAARPDFGDIRILDASGRQASYLVELGRRERMTVNVTALRRQGAESHFALVLPASPLTFVAVQIDVDSTYVHRAYRLVGEIDGRAHTIAVGVLERQGHQSAAIPLLFERHARADTLRLVIDDGDDAPLKVRSATITFATADLFVVAPTGAYTLLIGNGEVHPPRYELQAVRSRVADAPAGEVQAGPLELNPDHTPHLEAPPAKRDQTALLWGAIGMSVLILGALTLRVAHTT